jgi:hypothetical protein
MSDFFTRTTGYVKMHWVPILSIIAAAVALYMIYAKNKCASGATTCAVKKNDYTTITIALWVVVVASLLSIWF